MNQLPKNKFEQPTKAGYRDINLIFKSPEGVTAELQVNTKAMIVAKEREGHHLYEKSRTIEARAKIGNREMSHSETREVTRLNAEMGAVYSRAWEKSMGA